MGNWEKQIIREAFKRCFALQKALNTFKEIRIPIEALSAQTCISVKYITENLEEIKALN